MGQREQSGTTSSWPSMGFSTRQEKCESSVTGHLLHFCIGQCSPSTAAQGQPNPRSVWLSEKPMTCLDICTQRCVLRCFSARTGRSCRQGTARASAPGVSDANSMTSSSSPRALQGKTKSPPRIAGCSPSTPACLRREQLSGELRVAGLPWASAPGRPGATSQNFYTRRPREIPSLHAMQPNKPARQIRAC
jgi:hypothetical protein